MKAYYRDGKKYVPYNLAWDNMPIDLSFLYSEEKPAGKHGFLKVDGPLRTARKQDFSE